MAGLPALGRKDLKMKKEMNLTFVLIMALSFIFLSCDHITNDGHPMPDPTGIMGTVRDKISNQVIDSAWVKAFNPNIDRLFTAFTDSSGKYILGFIVDSSNQQIINAGKSGYITFDTVIQITLPQADYDTVNIYLTPE